MNIYIGNFSYDTTEDDLQAAFTPHGHVETIKIIKDKYTGQSKGFGFVTMPNAAEAQAALTGIKDIKGKRITINEARPQEQYRPRGGNSSGGGYQSRERESKPRTWGY